MSSNKIGYLEVIAGPMYCGKTEELIRLVRRAVIGRKKVLVIKHQLDKRYGSDKKLYSHNGISFNSELVDNTGTILKLVKDETELIAIDEAQWFGGNLIPVIQKLLKLNKHVIVAGLAMTFDKQPFTPIPDLMAMADKVIMLSAVCSICGIDAVHHKKISKSGPSVNALVADPGFVAKLDDAVFEARCRNCFDKKP